MAIGNPTTQPAGLENQQDSLEAMEQGIANLMDQFGEAETGYELDCGVDSRVLEAGMEELDFKVRSDEDGVLRELLKAYMDDEGKGDPNLDLTADMFQPRCGCDTLEGEGFRFAAPWVIAKAIGDALFLRSRELCRDMYRAAQNGDMGVARDLCHQVQGLEAQAERWYDASHRAFSRLEKAFRLGFQARNAESLPPQDR